MICNKCKKDLPESEFYKIRKKKLNLREICKGCHKKDIAEYRKSFNGKTSKALSNAKQIAKEINKNISHSFTVVEWREKVLRTNGICPMCNNTVGILVLTMDHCIPFCEAPEGFTYTIDDIQPLCPNCNTRKGKSTLYFV